MISKSLYTLTRPDVFVAHDDALNIIQFHDEFYNGVYTVRNFTDDGEYVVGDDKLTFLIGSELFASCFEEYKTEEPEPIAIDNEINNKGLHVATNSYETHMDFAYRGELDMFNPLKPLKQEPPAITVEAPRPDKADLLDFITPYIPKRISVEIGGITRYFNIEGTREEVHAKILAIYQKKYQIEYANKMIDQLDEYHAQLTRELIAL